MDGNEFQAPIKRRSSENEYLWICLKCTVAPVAFDLHKFNFTDDFPKISFYVKSNDSFQR